VPSTCVQPTTEANCGVRRNGTAPCSLTARM
jgi:hypothetical protein